jgi:hypothetical protein
MFQQQKAAPMVYSPSLKMQPEGRIGSGWVSLPEHKCESKEIPRQSQKDQDGDEKMGVGDQPGLSVMEGRKATLGFSLVSGPRSKGPGGNMPPTINNTLSVQKSVIRYTSGSSASISVSVADLIGSFGGICTATNSVFKPWTGSFRVRRITIWPAPVLSTALVCSLSWNTGVSGFAKDEERSSDIPEGVTFSKSVSFVPPKKALASDWMSGALTGNVWTMFSSVGSVIDVDAEFTLSNQFTPATQTIATGVLNTVYYLPLDGVSSHTYFPMHLPTTF